MPAPSIETLVDAPLARLLEARFELWLREEQRSPVSAAALDTLLRAPAQDFLSRPGKMFRGRLTRIAWDCCAPEGVEMPEELPWVVEVLHAGSLIVDDFQDRSQSRRGRPSLHRRIGAAQAINVGNFFYCWGLELLSELGLCSRRELSLYRHSVTAMRRCHEGQALDLGVRVHERARDELPSLVRASTELKAGTLLELAARLGAGAAGAHDAREAALADLGRKLGIGLQMLDDLGGVLSERRHAKAVEDLRGARPTWVWAWLARDCGPREFRSLQRRLGAVFRGSAPAALIEDLREKLAPVGAARVRRHLTRAWERAERQLGPSPILGNLRSEIERLQQSYV